MGNLSCLKIQCGLRHSFLQDAELKIELNSAVSLVDLPY